MKNFKRKYVFIILHYNEKSINDTFECVQSIKSIDGIQNNKIIVVENGSNDRSANLLNERYKEDKLVTILCSKENLGFARGNNLGCEYAIKNYTPDFLIVVNNDTVISQKEFLTEIDYIYKKRPFHVLGPYIYDRNYRPQNPVFGLKKNIEEVENSINEFTLILRELKKNPYLFQLKYNLKNKIRKIIFSNKYLENIMRKIFNKKKKHLINETIENVGLHGSALIFSRKYYLKYDNIFYPKTFMFVEEDILYHRVLRDNLKSVYYPKIKIYHKEDKSTDAILGTNLKKQEFIFKNCLSSLNVYREILKNGE